MSTPDARPRRHAVAWATTLALVATVFSAPASAAPSTTTIRDWNLNATSAIFNPSTAAIPGAGMTPPVGQLHLAMVQGAVYDAVNAIDRGHQPYNAGLPAASPSASIDAAVATAAHDVLVGLKNSSGPLLPAATLTWLEAAYLAALNSIDPGAPKDDGKAAGAAAAAAMLDLRTDAAGLPDDGRYGTFLFTIGDERGEWRPTPTVNDPFAWVAKVDPFLLDSSSQLRTKGPKPLSNPAYARQYNEVKRKGSATGSTRTQAETDLANFYFVNPVELWNRTFRGIAIAKGLDAADEARLFAMLNLAGADALISCWDDKAFWSFWRPVTAIHEGDNDGNRMTKGNPDWVPLLATPPFPGNPPYPDHPSGYNCVTGAFMHTARDFFGTNKVSFDVTNTATAVTRHYTRFTDVVEDTIDARVFQGTHFRSADTQGAGIGKKAAAWLDSHFFQPAP